MEDRRDAFHARSGTRSDDKHRTKKSQFPGDARAVHSFHSRIPGRFVAGAIATAACNLKQKLTRRMSTIRRCLPRSGSTQHQRGGLTHRTFRVAAFLLWFYAFASLHRETRRRNSSTGRCRSRYKACWSPGLAGGGSTFVWAAPVCYGVWYDSWVGN